MQQDGAVPHTANAVLEKLTNIFDGRTISLKTEHVWLPHSPDLKPLDFFLWGYLKDRVYMLQAIHVFRQYAYCLNALGNLCNVKYQYL